MSGLPPDATRVLTLARSGDLIGAITAGEQVLRDRPDDAPLTMFLGLLCCRTGDLPRGIGYLRHAVLLASADALPRIELARALLSAGETGEAGEIAHPLANTATPSGREMQRILAIAEAQAGRSARAAELFEALVAADPNDFESWRGLGTARLATGDGPAAVAALLTATRSRAGVASAWLDLARAQTMAQAPAEAAAAAERAAILAPDDPLTRLTFARALVALRRFADGKRERQEARARVGDDPTLLCAIADAALAAKASDEAETDYRRAIAAHGTCDAAWRGLAILLERGNRGDELRDVVAASVAGGIPPAATALPLARALRSEGRVEEAQQLLASVPVGGAEEIERLQLEGDLADRRGDVDAAFAAFSRANAARAAATIGSARHAKEYRARFGQLAKVLTPHWYAGWQAAEATDQRRAPLFVFGFPRSGTTLLDTLLAGHPETLVLEEEPTVERVSEAAGPIERLPTMSKREIAHLRDVYFDEVARASGDPAGRLIVDKQPLALASTPLLHRLFPEARFIFVERHPCDVVLSCFFMSAQMDAKVANFFDFTETARLYDEVLRYWRRCTDILAINTLAIRYERLIAAPEVEMRSLARFAGIDWDERLLSNQRNAKRRGYIGSPSYAQVAEPIYTRARGRWLRYRPHMEPVLPILRPWIRELGYPDPDA